MNDDHLITTVARETPCSRCRTATLTAHDEGMPVRVDATPLADAGAELATLLDGRKTYNHTSYGHLYYRDEWRIAAPIPPGTRIHAEHQCKTNEGPQQLTLNIGAK